MKKNTQSCLKQEAKYTIVSENEEINTFLSENEEKYTILSENEGNTQSCQKYEA